MSDEHPAVAELAAGAYPIEQLRQTIARLFPHANEAAARAHIARGVALTFEDYYEIRNTMAAVLRWHEEALRAAREVPRS